MNSALKLLFVATATLLVASPHTTVLADSAEVITRARAYADHPWRMTAANTTASCSAAYTSEFIIGDHMGLPYDWGGYMTLATFDRGLLDGDGAGSYPADDILACTVGLDCSGFVSQCWGAGHNTTSSMHQITREISRSELKRGDALNVAGYHVVLFSHLQSNGRPFVYESINYGVHPTFNLGWSYLEGFVPLRYLPDSDNENIVPVGTPDNPIDIALGPPGSPYRDIRNTSESSSDVFDYCGAAPSTAETGPEYVYRVQLDTPGRLVVNVQDDAGIDIDVHVYSDLTYQDCQARNDSTIDMRVDCGTYYIVADTWSSGGTEYDGEYELTVDFTPENTGCGVETGYDFLGAPGTECAYPGDYSLSYCNTALGSTTCVYSGTSASDMSFCTYECSTDAECARDFQGGCCVALDTSGDKYCLPEALCEDPVEPDAGLQDVSAPDVSTPDTSVGEDTPAADVATDTPASPDVPVNTDVPTNPDVPTVEDTAVTPDASEPDPEEDSGSFRPEDNNGSSNNGTPVFDEPSADKKLRQ